MRKDKEKAIELRRLGKSYREIRDILGIPLGTLSDWFTKESWSYEIGLRLTEERRKNSKIEIKELHRIRGLQLREIYRTGREDAEKEFHLLNEDPLFVAGVVIYWGEGDKVSKNNCRISNTDPKMVKLFKAFLEDICNIPLVKIRCSLLLYPDLDEENCKLHWHRETGMPLENFTKTMFIKGRHKTKRLSYGVCNLVVSSRYLKEKMLVWLRLIGRENFKADMV